MTGGAPQDAREPLIVALHGLGDRPDHFVSVFEGFATPARVVAPHSATRYSDGYSWFEFRRSDPDFSAPGIGRAADEVADFARAVAKSRPTAGKPIVMGFSQGGALSFALAAMHSDVVDATFPIGGWFPPALWPAKKPAPSASIVAFHGTADTTVPVARMRPGAARLAELGFSIDVREFDGVGHTISEPEHRELFDELAKACERERRAP
jgi:phospholipase/carboxylesterase